MMATDTRLSVLHQLIASHDERLQAITTRHDRDEDGVSDCYIISTGYLTLSSQMPE
jgi:hypothetical protein